MAALHAAVEIVRRDGTISLSGVYGGMADPLQMQFQDTTDGMVKVLFRP